MVRLPVAKLSFGRETSYDQLSIAVIDRVHVHLSYLLSTQMTHLACAVTTTTRVGESKKSLNINLLSSGYSNAN